MYYVYILKSIKDNGYYYGYTSDLLKRIEHHNSKLVRSTKSRAPFVLHYSEKFTNKSDAIKRENYFKSIDGYNWLRDNKIIEKG